VEEVLDTCDDEQGCLLVLLVLLIDFQKIFISFFSKDGNRAQAFHQAFAARRLRTSPAVRAHCSPWQAELFGGRSEVGGKHPQQVFPCKPQWAVALESWVMSTDEWLKNM
jgi:hypothetical protein